MRIRTLFITDQSTEVEVLDHFKTLLHDLGTNHMNVTAIKFVHNHFDIGLKDAKDIYDYIVAQS